MSWSINFVVNSLFLIYSDILSLFISKLISKMVCLAYPGHLLVQIQQQKEQNNALNLFKTYNMDSTDLNLVSLLLTLNKFQTLFVPFYC